MKVKVMPKLAQSMKKKFSDRKMPVANRQQSQSIMIGSGKSVRKT